MKFTEHDRCKWQGNEHENERIRPRCQKKLQYTDTHLNNIFFSSSTEEKFSSTFSRYFFSSGR